MNFFEYQERARRNTGWLLVLFTVAVIALGVGVYLATMVGLHLSRGHVPIGAVAYQYHGGHLRPIHFGNADTDEDERPGSRALATIGWWNPGIFAGCFIVTLIVILLASLARTAGLRTGGVAVAEMMHARVVPPGGAGPREAQLRNVVEEMALAAAIPVPQIFVLDEEQSINAFAAGHTPADAAIVVTRGALERLNRDELQGVVGHEFSHILNGDMKMNINLMGVLFGILVIGVIGRAMMRIWVFGGGGGRRRGGRGGGGSAALAFVAAGALVALIGYAGLVCARLIKAAVSRQREYLADAASVQFTRNPNGIAGALKKIGGFALGSKVNSPRAEETSHFFFCNAVSYAMFGGLFATHPPLVQRIRRIDPAFDGKFDEVRVVEGEEAAAPAFAAAPPAAAPRFTVDPAAVTARVGNPIPAHTDYAAALLRELPDALRTAVQSAFSASALVYAMLLSEDEAIRARQMESVRRLTSAALVSETWRLAAALSGTEQRWWLPVAKLSMPALRTMTLTQRTAFARTVEELIAADAQVSLFEYAISRTLLRHLSAGRVPPAKMTINAIEPVRGDCQVLLTCLARHGGEDEAGAQRAYAAGAARLPLPPEMGLLPEGESCALPSVDAALEHLLATVPRVRETIVDACAHCVLADGTVTLEEAELLRVVADALDCPLPAFLTPAA